VLRRLTSPGATREDWVFDAVLAGLALVLVEVPYLFLAWLFGQIRDLEVLAAAGVTGALMMLPVVLRRHAPLLMMVLVAVAAVGQLVTVPVPTASIVVVPLCAYSVARWVEGLASRTVVAVGAVGAAIAPVRWIIGPFGTQPMALLSAGLTSLVCLGLVITPYAIGRRARDVASAKQRELDAEAERHRMQLSEREQRVRVAEETARNRIARDLHDVVAHSVSVMVVQAEGGRAIAAKNPDAALRALETIADTGREALGEMRRLVGVLRQGSDEVESYAPSPRLTEIPEMAARAGAALDVTGEPGELSPTVELTAYRIIQEALTNVLKHAGPNPEPVVHLTYTPAAVEVAVTDSGTGPSANDDGLGNGLRGMQERVAALGGSLETGAGPNGGYHVRATLPRRG